MTAAVLLGTAEAGVHKLKMKKIPLEDQLVSSLVSITRLRAISLWFKDKN